MKENGSNQEDSPAERGERTFPETPNALSMQSAGGVCVCDILEEQAKRFVESLPTEQRNNIIFQKCDVTSFAEFKICEIRHKTNLLRGPMSTKGIRAMIKRFEETGKLGVTPGRQLLDTLRTDILYSK
ncbi:hypothetical protein TNCV_3329161 [Trichonephila clavipes]|nr:hypothetical protein TNCV_3329161 [Trichonephila clavipes]